MRIPDGDLVPARRRRYTGGYGRHRHRRTRRFAIVAVVVLAAAAVAWFLQRDDTPAPRAAVTTCASPTVKPTPTTTAVPLPAAAKVRLVVLNGTPRNQLAQQVGTALVARGFVVLSTGNAPAAVAGPSVVTYGPGAGAAATVLSRNVLGSRLVSAPGARAGSLRLVLGGDFRRLATSAEITAAGGTSSAAVVVPAPIRSPCAA